MSVLCYNKGCGQRVDPESNPKDACTYHPGVPAFHDALKGCTEGPHNSEKPLEPVKPDVKVSGEKKELKPRFNEYVIQAPKPLVFIQRPSSDEPLAAGAAEESGSVSQSDAREAQTRRR